MTTKEDIMAKIQAIADQTRAKTSKTNQMTLDEIASAIGAIESGGGYNINV